jgi:hypothetical protein
MIGKSWLAGLVLGPILRMKVMLDVLSTHLC